VEAYVAVKTFDTTATGSTDCSVHCRILGWTSPLFMMLLLQRMTYWKH